jgi:hypothetical protein
MAHYPPRALFHARAVLCALLYVCYSQQLSSFQLGRNSETLTQSRDRRLTQRLFVPFRITESNLNHYSSAHNTACA